MLRARIGQRIKICRKAKGLTQEQLAERIDLSRNYLSAVERGVNQISLEKLVELMNVLECSADEIFVDVIKAGAQTKASILSEKIKGLPFAEQMRILEVVDTLIKTAETE
ncbi:MAG: helix-turn-helix transcriptional regulator [Clostridia bacterium]|nr:helix-turn-helix transcriptional regulator [Clostridia bacterium]